MTQTHSTTPPQYFQWIDALRGLAAIAVVVFHYHHFYLADALARPLLPETAQMPYSGLVGLLYDYGDLAVQLFWVISGFVFTHVYVRLYADQPASLRQFTVARIARLYPLHFATLLYMAGLQAFSLQSVGHWQIYSNNDSLHFALQMVMASNMTSLSRGLSFNGPIWSVSVEIAAYAMFFVALTWVRRGPILVPLMATLIGFAIAHFKPGIPLLRLGVFLCAGYFFAGVLLYGICERVGWRRGLLGALALALAAGAGAASWLGAPVLALLLACLAIVSAVSVLDGTFSDTGAWLRPLGDLSYSIYLIHVPMQASLLLIADLFLGGTRAFAQTVWLLPTYVGVSIILALAVHRWFEKPAGRWLRQRLSPPRAPTPAS